MTQQEMQKKLEELAENSEFMNRLAEVKDSDEFATAIAAGLLISDEKQRRKVLEMSVDEAMEEFHRMGYHCTLNEFQKFANSLSKTVNKNITGELDVDDLSDVTGGYLQRLSGPAPTGYAPYRAPVVNWATRYTYYVTHSVTVVAETFPFYYYG